jgi:hypothetical protein
MSAAVEMLLPAENKSFPVKVGSGNFSGAGSCEEEKD